MTKLEMSPTVISSPRLFDSMLDGMERGQAMVYHEGLLMRDRQGNEDVNAVAWRAWRAMEAGAVALVQARLNPGVCAYLAVKL